MEFHPFASVFEQDWSLGYPYFGGGNAFSFEDGIGDYDNLVPGPGNRLFPPPENTQPTTYVWPGGIQTLNTYSINRPAMKSQE